MVFNIFDKKLSATRANTFTGSNTSGGVVKSEILPNQKLAEEF